MKIIKINNNNDTMNKQINKYDSINKEYTQDKGYLGDVENSQLISNVNYEMIAKYSTTNNYLKISYLIAIVGLIGLIIYLLYNSYFKFKENVAS